MNQADAVSTRRATPVSIRRVLFMIFLCHLVVAICLIVALYLWRWHEQTHSSIQAAPENRQEDVINMLANCAPLMRVMAAERARQEVSKGQPLDSGLVVALRQACYDQDAGVRTEASLALAQSESESNYAAVCCEMLDDQE